ncbi:MAG: hypothetical protein KAW56_11935 [Candidatus Marinimicrobia bacterium]|nr:hypothetical protein [Candidatus Neomarinimicrobiota bacterium]
MTKYLLPLILILLLTFTLIGDCWVSGYDQRIKLTTDHTKIDDTLSNFTVTAFFTAAQAEEIFTEFDADGDFDRVQFALDDDTLLYADCELFDDSASLGIYHFKPTSLSSSAGTDIYFYYDNDHAHNTTYIGISGTIAAQNAYDEYFKGVWHLFDNGFELYSSNPVITRPTGADPYRSSRAPFGIYVGSEYKVYYYEHDSEADHRKISLATASNGYTFTKSESNPVLEETAETWDAVKGVGYPCIFYEDSTYYLFYVAADVAKTGLATSANGTSFTKITDGIGGTSMVLDHGSATEWDEDAANICTVVWRADDSKYWAYYAGNKNGVWSLGLAKSTDLKNWTRYGSNPIMTGGEAWEGNIIATGLKVFYSDGKWRMYYRGNSGNNNAIGYAESSDGLSWTKSSNNPLWEEGSGWEDDYRLDPNFVFLEGNSDKKGLLYYTGKQINQGNQIGVMTQLYRGNFDRLGDCIDSTSNGNDGTKKGVDEPVEATGKVGQGQDFDGSDDYINCGDNASLRPAQTLTYECLVYPISTPGGDTTCIVGDYGYHARMLWNSSDKFKMGVQATAWAEVETDAQTKSNWYHVAFTYDGSIVRGYLNGTEFDTNSDASGDIDWGGDDLITYLGSGRAGTILRFLDKLDEPRISATIRAAAWMKATYNSLYDTLLTYGSEETAPTGVNVLFMFSNF